MTAGPCCGFDLDTLRAMMREEFGARGQRDLAVAEAVAAWYTRQHPELLITIDQPHLPGIIAGIRPPAADGEEYHNAPPIFLDHQWTPEEIAAITDRTKGPRPPMEFNTIKKGGAQ